MNRKLNDLSQSPLRLKFSERDFVPDTNLSVAMGRVSDKRQKGEAHQSDKAQVDTINGYLKHKDLVLAHDIWDVAETASKHNKRTNFNEMLSVVENSQVTKRPIKHIIFSHQSRSNRNRESAREIERLVRQHGVTLHCVRDGLVLTALSTLEDWIKWDLFNSLNEKHIDDHRRNVWDGMMGRVEIGLFPGKAPFGFKNYRANENALSVFIHDTEGPAQYMKSVFEMLSTGLYNLTDIHAELGPKFPGVAKKPSVKLLWELVRNPFYYGDFLYLGQTFHGDPEKHPPLVSFEIWQKAQDVLNSGYKKRVNKTKRPYLGLMKCGGRVLDAAGKETDELCGCSVTAEVHRKKLADGTINLHFYYHCSNTTRRCSQRDKGYMREIAGRGLNYPEAEIEILFEAVFRPLHFTPEVCAWMQGVLINEHHEKSRNHGEQLAAFQSRHKMLERYIDQAYEDKLAGSIHENLWREKNSKWLLELQEVKNQIDSIGAEKQDYIQNGVLLIELAQRTEYIYKNATPEVKRRLVEIVSYNQTLKNGSVEFDYRKPFDMLAKPDTKDPSENWWSGTESNQGHVRI